MLTGLDLPSEEIRISRSRTPIPLRKFYARFAPATRGNPCSRRWVSDWAAISGPLRISSWIREGIARTPNLCSLALRLIPCISER